MRRIDPDELTPLGDSARRAVLLDGRPAAPDSRVQWWIDFFDRCHEAVLRAAVTSSGTAPDRMALMIWAIDLAVETGDLSPVDTAVLTARLTARLGEVGYRGDRPDRLRPDSVARRCITAMPLRLAQLPEAVARERHYLLEDERAWLPRSDGAVDDRDAAVFDRLDDLRRLLRALRSLAGAIEDAALAARVQRWLAVEPHLDHDEAVQRRGRQLLERRRGPSPGRPPAQALTKRPLPGTIVTGTVVASIRSGIFVRLDRSDREGFVDQGLVDDLNPSPADRHWPAAGTAVTAAVHRYTPDGQLRLTMRPSDLAWAQGREPSPDFWRGRELEVERLRRRPMAQPPAGLLAWEIEPIGDPRHYAVRLRSCLEAALRTAAKADFEAEEIDAGQLPDWFVAVTEESGGAGPTPQECRLGRQRYYRAYEEQEWTVQEWLFCFDPDLRNWRWWDLTTSGDRVTLWLDSKGEPMVAAEELRWALFAAGANDVRRLGVLPADSWGRQASLGVQGDYPDLHGR
jgi:hypothetical protein